MSDRLHITWRTRLLLVAAGGCVALAIVELVLQLYNPFGFRIRGDCIVPPVHAVCNVRNLEVEGLDRSIVHTKNSLGFRGPEPPPDFDRLLTIVAIGGSTTECYLLSDGKDWPTLLGRKLAEEFDDVWINNAGFDGTSTYGHIVLVQDYVRQLQPKVALFLVGRIELFNIEGQALDYRFLRPTGVRSLHEGIRLAAWYSETVSKVYNLLYRYLKARRYDLVHATPGAATGGTRIDVPIQERGRLTVDADRERMLAAHAPALRAYRARLEQLIAATRLSNIEPVFMRQPLLLGPAVDEDTSVDLTLVEVSPSMNGPLAWEILERYNDVLRDVSARKGVDLIDFARLMPKRSRYFYDAAHYTNAGSARVAETVAPELARILARRWPTYRKDQSAVTVTKSS